MKHSSRSSPQQKSSWLGDQDLPGHPYDQEETLTRSLAGHPHCPASIWLPQGCSLCCLLLFLQNWAGHSLKTVYYCGGLIRMPLIGSYIFIFSPQLVNCLRMRSYGLVGGGMSLELALRFQKRMSTKPSPSPIIFSITLAAAYRSACKALSNCSSLSDFHCDDHELAL